MAGRLAARLGCLESGGGSCGACTAHVRGEVRLALPTSRQVRVKLRCSAGLSGLLAAAASTYKPE